MRQNVFAIFIAFASFAVGGPGHAQSADFNLTFHVERTPARELSTEACAAAISSTADQAGLRRDLQTFPGQLVTVHGGTEGVGAFIVQCIAVEQATVSVIQGIDYGSQKGRMGAFADAAFNAVKQTSSH